MKVLEQASKLSVLCDIAIYIFYVNNYNCYFTACDVFVNITK